MKVLVVIISTLLLIQHGYCGLTATANLHVDSSMIAVGTVLFYQRDEISPVRVIGILDGLKSNTVHVC